MQKEKKFTQSTSKLPFKPDEPWLTFDTKVQLSFFFQLNSKRLQLCFRGKISAARLNNENWQGTEL